MNVKENYGIALKAIWEKYPDASSYVPMCPKDVLENSILFLGINPSVSDLTKRGEETWEMDFNTTFKESCDKPHNHYKKFYDLREVIIKTNPSIQFTYMDLLFCQETKQANIQKLLKTDEAFILEQAKITVEIISKIKPKLVIVSNKTANQIIHQYAKEIGFSTAPKGEVWHFNGIPIIAKESDYMASRFMKKDEKDKYKEILIAKIKSTLKTTENWNK